MESVNIEVDKSESIKSPSIPLETEVKRKIERPKRVPNLPPPSPSQELKQQEAPVIDLVDSVDLTSFSDTVESSGEVTCRVKKPARRHEDETDGKGLSDSEDENEDILVVRRGRGRPSGASGRKGRGRGRGRGRGKRVDTEYVPRPSSSFDKKQTTDVVCETVDNNDPEETDATVPILTEVECGKCMEKVSKKLWSKHNLIQHNGMGWLAGATKPVSLVM